MPPADYYRNVNPDLLRFIPPDAKTVLEIGCGEGALCEAYRRVNPGVEWTGIDSNAEALAVAKTHDVVAWLDDLNESLPALGWDDHDVLILGDVLEHLRDPWETLKWAALWLAPGAQVLACIPNVQHWTVIRDLLSGKWDYQDSGLMDRTHLRFFTLDSIQKMFADAGLQVFEVVGRDLCNEGLEKWLDEAPVHYAEGTRRLDEVPKEWRAYQYVVRAIKPAERPLFSMPNLDVEVIPSLHIHAVLGEACCARPRILEPFRFLGTIPGVRCMTGRGEAFSSPLPDITILQRHRAIDLGWARSLSATGITIAEIDDDPTNPVYLDGATFDPMVFKAVHAVQCSTEAIAEIVRQWNPNVMVFPNQIAELPPWREKPVNKPLRIFFAAQARVADWQEIMPALNRVLADHPEIHVCCMHGEGFSIALETKNKSWHPFSEYEVYRKLLGECDIALLPLLDNQFNRCKSDVKFLECAAEGVACIVGQLEYERLCSIDQVACAPKDDRLKNGTYVWGYNNAATFERALRGAIDYADYRREVAENAYYYVSKYRLLSQHFRTQYAWYLSLLATKSDLDQQLLERVPELQSSLQPA